MKKMGLILISAIALTMAFVGCSKNSESKKATTSAVTGTSEVLEFYHGYYHDAYEWAPAAVMREIYDQFAEDYATGSVQFKAIPTEDIDSIIQNKVAGGSYPDLIDLAGRSVSFSAISQNLLLDLKPYIDSQNIQANVGLNYTQNNVNGKIYTVHDQLLTLGYWYNEKVFTDAGVGTPNTWKTWTDFDAAMEKIRKSDGDVYAYGAGQGSARCFNAVLGMTDNGKKILSTALTDESINSREFEDAFKQIARMDQKNGSVNASSNAFDGANDWSADFNRGKSAVFFNGVWAAGGFSEVTNFKHAIFPGNVALSAASGGITVANKMSDAKKQLALEFIKYMTSDEIQTRIFKEVGANPCTTTLDLNELAEGSDYKTQLLAYACAQANSAENIVVTLDVAWGTDIANAIGNKLIECTVAGADIDAKFDELKKELIGLIG